MKRNANKKGMTLVEVIIAMSIFAIITTGFVMTAKYAYSAQVKAKRRLTQSNKQTTNLEDYRGVVDPTYEGMHDTDGVMDIGVQKMGGLVNTWKMVYAFDTATIENDQIYGYYSTPDVDDKVFQMAYFSPSDVVALDEGEYWITITNDSPTVDLPLNISCDSGYLLFNNEKKVFPSRTSMPERLLPAGGYRISFGLKDISATYRSTGGVIKIDNPMADYGTPGVRGSIDPSIDRDDDPDDHYVVYSFNGTGLYQVT